MTEPSGNPGKLPATSDDIVQRAREALDGITPGPWKIDEHDESALASIVSVADDRLGGWVEVARSLGDDARFIAAAPDLVRDLLALVEIALPTVTAQRDDALAEVERLRTAVEELEADRDTGYRNRMAERDELRAEVETAQKWAAWFAAAYNWRRECDNALNWGTTCLNCASMLDRSYDDYMRAEEAEQKAKAASREVEKLHAAVERVRELIDDDHHVWEDSDGDGLWVHVDNVRRALDGEAARG